MSILNICAKSGSVYVYSDTWASGGIDAASGRRIAGHVGKLVPLPASNCVLAFRGQLLFGVAVSISAGVIPNASFDRLVTALPSLMDRAWEAHQAQFAQAGVTEADAMKQDMALAGWSDNMNRMDAVVFMKSDDGGFTPFDAFDSPWLTPWPDRWGPAPTFETETEHLSLAKRQVAMTRAEAPEVSIGGRLVGAEVTRSGIRLFQSGELS